MRSSRVVWVIMLLAVLGLLNPAQARDNPLAGMWSSKGAVITIPKEMTDNFSIQYNELSNSGRRQFSLQPCKWISLGLSFKVPVGGGGTLTWILDGANHATSTVSMPGGKTETLTWTRNP
jgi:hypothetical protein